MATDVTVTGTKYYNKDEIASIIEIWREIFPDKIEEKYVELANLLFQYKDEAINILNGNRNINEIGQKLTKNDEARKSTDVDIDKMINLLTAMKGKKLSAEELRNFRKQVDALDDSFRLTAMGNLKEASLEREYDDNRFLAGNAHNSIENLVAQIEVKLQEIDDLSIDGEDRLDRIQITDKHLSKIDNIQGLSPQVKETLKKLLQAYMNMKVSAFKATVEQAHEIGSAYKAREIIDYGKQYDPRVAKQALIGLSLIVLENDFMDDLEHFMLHYNKNFEQYNVERSNDFCKVLEWYTSYFNGESMNIDIDSIDSLTRNNNHHINSEPLVTLRNIVFQAQAQNLETGHHK